MNVVCDAPRDLVRIGRYHYTHRPYVGIGMLVAQVAERRAELAFLRSTWPRGSTQPIGAASEGAVVEPIQNHISALTSIGSRAW